MNTFWHMVAWCFAAFVICEIFDGDIDYLWKKRR